MKDAALLLLVGACCGAGLTLVVMALLGVVCL